MYLYSLEEFDLSVFKFISTISKVTNSDIGTKLVNMRSHVPHLYNKFTKNLLSGSFSSNSKYPTSFKYLSYQRELYWAQNKHITI